MHGHGFIFLGHREHAFLGSALYFIQVTWFTFVFANIDRVSEWAICRMPFRPSDIQ